ncbi:cyclic peptide export ABC transporter [Marinibactrum halimedae]|uniref:ABC transporter ATP-binding protein n=1 Tax=Marinibactrum halimedae TaxID=1444977 RepID=A0AA37WKK2_9GAMM|nr:cyclic peptide export ABC transporter [Marinibactrum halimedae]MCD9460851.1 cyclic peptide export ABC transporter [Marinibactrum halimedae]GLS24559.1 ABC transporter ATP-binding protein [Marinibactrum halimedae]
MPANQDNSAIRLFGLLTDTSSNKVFFSTVLGALGGIAYAIFVPLIMMALQPSLGRLMQPEFDTSYWLFGVFEISSPNQALFFFMTCMLILFCRGTSGTLMFHVAIDATVGLRKKIYSRISKLPIQTLEEIGPSRLLTALNNDVSEVANGASSIPNILVAATTLVGMLAFLVYLRLEIFLFVLGVMAFGFLTYQIPVRIGGRHLAAGRNSFDGIQEGIRGLIYGAKELKLNKEKQQAFLKNELHEVEKKFSDSFKTGRMFMIFAMTYSNLISFFTIGAVTYVIANYYTLTRDDLLGSVMVLLYILGPITVFVNTIPNIAIARVAARKLNSLLKDMTIEYLDSKIVDNIECHQKIVLKNVEYTYQAKKNEELGFHLGPINLTLNRGEVAFFVGGNGSGKTTLGKILSLHYIPEKGDIYFDAAAVTDGNRNICRQSISAIYSDFYLFTELFGLSDNELDSKASEGLKQLGLEGKVTIENGKFSTTSLSDGQKKRLALLVAYLEDRSIYIFDEWAADQDPEFKEIFYHRILPDLKRLNKLVIVITHDDRYFHLADKLVRMENGQEFREGAFSTDKHAHSPEKSEMSPSGEEEESVV